MEQQGKPLPEEELKISNCVPSCSTATSCPTKFGVPALYPLHLLAGEHCRQLQRGISELFKYITTYDPQRSILNWIHIVTKRFVMEQNRRHGRLPVSENVDVYSLASSLSDEDDTHGNAMGMENYREFYNDDILNALDSLKPIYREALLLQQAGYKLEEIVEISYRNGNMKSRSLDTMKSRIFLAKQQMRKLITPDGEKR